MNIVQNILKQSAKKAETKKTTNLFEGATKKATASSIKYTLNNVNFFTENHKYFGVINKSAFTIYVKALNNEQRKGLWLLFHNLTNGKKILVSEVKYDKDGISYVDIKTTYERKSVSYKLYYFWGMHKLLSFATNTKYNLDLRELVKIAKQK